MKNFLFLAALALFAILLSASACNPQLNNNKPSSEPATAHPPADYESPAAPVPLENLSKDCYEAVTTSESIPCPDLYAPICGCDGRNYSNTCQAERAGIKKWKEGNCN